MGAIMNGISLYGGLFPFGGTFLVFSDYVRSAIRLSSIQKLHVMYEFTHDSIFVGEDGTTLTLDHDKTATFSGNVTGQYFNGVATSAQYADLAERYNADADYLPGTVVAIGGNMEITGTTSHMDTNVFGVISTAPAYLMNAEADGQAVALKGRVPVRVMGPVNKGDKLYVGANGTAQKADEGDLIGIALESNDRHEEKLVETFLKV